MKKKKWTAAYLDDYPHIVQQDTTRFPALIPHKVNVLEIGTGKGIFIFKMAIHYPEYDFIGIERNPDVLALALKKINSDPSITNIRLINCDIENILETVPNNSLDHIFIAHPDPWPKRRHHKRRLTFPPMLEQYFRILKENGCLYFKTDNDSFFDDSLSYVKEHGKFDTTSLEYEYDNKEDFDAYTEYEKRFRESGIKIKRMVLRKEKKSDEQNSITG